jgi:2-hydroxychromene-2-carboxylate isomerase
MPGHSVVEQSESPEYERQLESTPRDAAALGVFGSPTFVGDQMFFGNDRLDFVRAVQRQVVQVRKRCHSNQPASSPA